MIFVRIFEIEKFSDTVIEKFKTHYSYSKNYSDNFDDFDLTFT